MKKSDVFCFLLFVLPHLGGERWWRCCCAVVQGPSWRRISKGRSVVRVQSDSVWGAARWSQLDLQRNDSEKGRGGGRVFQQHHDVCSTEVGQLHSKGTTCWFTLS